MNDFLIQHSASLVDSNDSAWRAVYKKVFPTLIAVHNHSEFGDHQMAGIDKTVVLKGGIIRYVDEKVRYQDYGDILLEESSSIEKHIPGWIEKPLLAHYVFYKTPSRLYVLPNDPLHSAWYRNKDAWQGLYGPPKRAKNATLGGYTSLNWAIPIDELYAAMFSPYILNI